jgi:hypothetical protein
MNQLFLRNQLCIPVKGYNRAIIYDILRKDYFFVPNEYYTILNTNDFIPFLKIKDTDERQELVNFLIQEEIIFELSDPDQRKRFTPLDRNLHTPNQFSNLVVHANIDHNFFDFIAEEYLMNISIIAPELDANLLKIVEKINTLETDGIYLYIENFNAELFEEYCEAFSAHQLVFSVNFFGTSTTAKTKLISNIYYNFFEESFADYKSKLTIDKLDINGEHFFEAYNYHSYYFGKIYIDAAGHIKNGLNNSASYGNIQCMSKAQFLNTISSSAFLELGNIKKSDTLVCKDCEFRYMCVDSRVPIKGDEKWYHETECRYNPFMSKWDDELGYLNLSNAGITISASGCEINKKKLKQEFKKAWSV